MCLGRMVRKTGFFCAGLLLYSHSMSWQDMDFFSIL